MKGFRVLFAAAVGLVTYLLLCTFLGQAGVLEYRKLSAYRERLSANIAELDRIQARLSERVLSLQSDPENIQLRARALGYFLPGEKLIRLPGYDPNQQVTSPGMIVYRTDRPADPRNLFRGIAFAVAVLAYLVSMLDRSAVQNAGRYFRSAPHRSRAASGASAGRRASASRVTPSTEGQPT